MYKYNIMAGGKIFLIIFLILLNIIFPLIMTFLSIGPETYINYLGWINALAIFYLILPENVSINEII